MSRRTTRRERRTKGAAQRATTRIGPANRIAHFVHTHPLSFALALAGVHAALSLLALDPTPHTGGDNAGYITLARSLLERGAYLELWDPAEPLHTKYPPVFPLVLAAAMALGVQPWVGLKVIVVAFSALAVAFSFLWIRARGRTLIALGAATLLALSPGILLQNHWVLSDVPFWALTMMGLWALQTAPRRGLSMRFGLAVLFVVLAYFTRSAGLPLALAALAWLGWRRRWLQASVLALILAPLALAWWLRARAAGGVDYAGELWMRNPYDPAVGTIGVFELLPRMGENFTAYLTVHVPFLLLGHAGAAAVVLAVLLTILALAGWVRRMLRLKHVTAAELMLPLYIGLIFVWPAVWAGDRFMLPVFALLLFYAGDALGWLAAHAGGRLALTIPVAAVALVALLQLPTAAVAARIGRECQSAYGAGIRYPCVPAQWQEFFAQAERLPELVPDGAVVLSRKPRLVHVMSGGRTHSLTYPFTADAQAFLESADTLGARYLLFDRLDRVSQAYVVPVLTRRPAAFCLADAYGGTAVFGIVEGATVLPDASPGAAPDFAPCAPASVR